MRPSKSPQTTLSVHYQSCDIGSLAALLLLDSFMFLTFVQICKFSKAMPTLAVHFVSFQSTGPSAGHKENRLISLQVTEGGG